MSILTIESTGYEYGYSKDNTETGKNTFYLGKTNSHTYDSSIKFQNTFSLKYSFIIKSITLKTKKKAGTPYNNLNIHLSENASAYPGSYTKIKSLLGAFNSNSVIITDSEFLGYIQEYLENGTTFYIHITGSNAGGTLYGYNTSDKPTLEIEWDYAASTGSLDKTTFSVGETVNLTLDIKETGYTHDITWTINNLTGTITSGLTKQDYSFSISPGRAAIDSCFPNLSKQSNGFITIITKDGGTQIGEVVKLYFTIVLTEGYCKSSGYVTLERPTFTVDSEQVIKDIFIANRSTVKVTCKSSTISSKLKLSSPKLVVSGGLFGTKMGTNTVTTTIGTKALVATYTVVDSRGFSYSSNKTSDDPIFYNDITLSDVNFYRTNDEGEKDIMGKRIGCSFIVNSPVNVQNVFVKYDTYQTSLTSPYSSTDLFGDVFETSKSYELKIYIKNDITADPSLYGYANDGYYIYSVKVSKAEYIIHIPKGGQGIAFGSVYTNENEAVIDCGWPILASKGLKIPYGPNREHILNFSNYASLESFHEALGLSNSYLRLSGGTITGSLKLTNNAYICNPNDQLLLSYNCSSASGATDGTCLGYHGNITTIRGNSLKYYNGSNTYDILHSGNYNDYADKIITLRVGLTDDFKSYEGTDSDFNNEYYPPGVVAKKNGKIIQVDGAISPTKTGKGGAGEENEITICHLPEGYQPNYSIIQVCQGSSTSTWMLRIRPNGYLTFSRYRNEAGYANYTTTTWLTFHVCFIQK